MIENNYFKGWYFKCSDNDKTISFIPAYHRHKNKETASLQIITDNEAHNIPLNSMEYSEKPLLVNLKNCIFSEKGITLNIQHNNLTVKGNLEFCNLSPIKYDIMGPFRFIPFMQCRHHVYSMNHRVNGQINLNGKPFIFENGIGYIEGDSGRSFPKQYIWTQCCFENGSLMLSVADIPLSGFHFTGIICIVLLSGKEYRIATYLGASLQHIDKNTVTVTQGDYVITAQLVENNAQPLYAPISGKMNRTIHESASCKAYYKFSYKGKTLFEFKSNKSSFEFEYTP